MDSWDKALKKLTMGAFQENAPKENFLEIPEHIGSETMDYDPTGDAIDWLEFVITRRLKKGEVAGKFVLGERLDKLLVTNLLVIRFVAERIFLKWKIDLLYTADPPTLAFRVL